MELETLNPLKHLEGSHREIDLCVSWGGGVVFFFFFLLINWKLLEHDNMLMGVIQQRGSLRMLN